MRSDPSTDPSDHQEALLARLRELARERDAVPEHVRTAARSALRARRRAGRERADSEAPEGG